MLHLVGINLFENTLHLLGLLNLTCLKQTAVGLKLI